MCFAIASLNSIVSRVFFYDMPVRQNSIKYFQGRSIITPEPVFARSIRTVTCWATSFTFTGIDAIANSTRGTVPTKPTT